MKALFVYSTKYMKHGELYYETSQTATVWQERYLNIFDELNIVGRVKECDNPERYTISSTDNVNFHLTKLGLNAIEYFTKRKEIEAYIEKEVLAVDFVIARQSFFAAIAVKYAKKYNKPYVVEVVGSSWDANWNYSLKGKLVAPYFEIQAKNMIKNANYVVYVTQQFLQKEYPTNGKSIGISNVKITGIREEALAQRLEKIESTDMKTMTLCTTAAVDVKYKGQAYVLEAMYKLKKKGYDLRYIIIGGGNQDRLRNLCERYELTDNVIFTGSIKHDEVYDHLSKADIYIQPSLQEGLPRAMIEAMSCAMPAIGFKTAGIPELIDKKYVCRRKSVSDICKCIESMTRDEMYAQAKKNFESAKEYEFDKINHKRKIFISEAAGIDVASKG